MYIIQDIENKLKSINPAAFQELCDCFLSFKNNNYRAFSRSGSQIGKQKTIKGTPDTIFLLHNGKYILVEYSTNISEGVSKIQDDIQKCLDVNKTGIPIDDISEIIICVNFKLDPKEIYELNRLVNNTNIILSYCTLDSLSIDLLQHGYLVHKYLGIALDTGQIVPISTFIEEYNRATQRIATPLDNPFYHRENELFEINNLIKENDILVIYGSPGVGKTRLVLETINKYISENLEFNAFCLSNKCADLLDDLRQYFKKDKKNILFIDDANRIDMLRQVFSFYNEQKAGNFKIILTVRDYAYNILLNMFNEYKYYSHKIEKLTDEHIKDIIKEKPFKVLDYQSQKDIIRISDGNPRLAIMAALLANESQDIYSLYDASDLFEKYYATFINDENEFSNPTNMKILGLIAIFHTIPLDDKYLLLNILDNFNISYDTFIYSIDRLNKLELIETFYGYVKIQEQNIATFFFYKSFIKDNLLSFEKIINKYIDNNLNRFSDCVISANNIFGYNNVIKKIQPIIKNYWISINNDEVKSFKYLEIFWFCLQDEFFEYLYKKIESLPEVQVPVYEVEYNTQNKSYRNNDLLRLLNNFFNYSIELKYAIELSFELVRKIPDNLPELINYIKGTLIYRIEDSYNGFNRQHTLFNVLLNGLKKNDALLTSAFFEISKYFLPYKYDYTKSGRGNTIEICYYHIPDNKNILKIRKNIWESVNEYFCDKAFEVLKSYLNTRSDINKNIMEFDIQYLLNIIFKYFSVNSFEHCKYVQELICLCKRNNINHSEFNKLKHDFINHLYKMYIIIDWNRYRDKEDYEFENYHEYELIKEAEIRKSFIFKNKEEISKFYKDFLFLYKSEKENAVWKYNNSIDIIIDENFNKNIELGCQIIIEIIENNLDNFIPIKTFKNQLTSEINSNIIWETLQRKDFIYKPAWEFVFYETLSDFLINDKYISAIKTSFKNMNYYYCIFFERLQKFFIKEPKLIEKLLIIISNRNNEEVKLYLGDDVFEIYFEQNEANLDLIKKLYLQQLEGKNYFDHEKTILFKILQKDINFLIEYIEYVYKKNIDKYNIDYDDKLGIIWKLENIESILTKIFDFLCKDDICIYIFENYCNSFFSNLQKDEEERALSYILIYIENNYNDINKMNVIVDIARHAMNEYFNDILLKFLSLTQDIEIFSKISWTGNGRTIMGEETTFGDLEASDWKNILSIIEKSDIGIALIPIKQYINLNIESSKKMAEQERRRRYFEKR